MRLFDTHCHLQDSRLLDRLPAVLGRAADAGVGRIACCGTWPGDWPVVRALADGRPGVLPFFGLHPLYAAKRSNSWLDELEQFLADSPSGVGEIGLDFLARDPDRRDQEHVFVEQFRLARRMNRPVSVHCRKAFGALIEIVRREGPAHDGCVMHSYSGPAELVPDLESMGFFISFSGAVARPGNVKGPKALRAVSLDRLLVETDSPDIAPDSGMGEPCDLPVVVRAVAGLLGVSCGQLAGTLARNAERAFAALAALLCVNRKGIRVAQEQHA